MHLELSCILGPVAVEERIVHMAFVVFICVNNAFIGAGLVEETFAVRIDLQPRLRTHPEEPGIAGLGGLRAGFLIGTKRAAVENHQAVRLIHLGAGPQAGFDAIAEGARFGTVHADHAQVPGLHGFHHGIVQGISARADDRALIGNIFHILVILVFGDTAGDFSVFLHQFDHGGVVMEFGAQRGGIVIEDLIAVQDFAGSVIASRPAR